MAAFVIGIFKGLLRLQCSGLATHFCLSWQLSLKGSLRQWQGCLLLVLVMDGIESVLRYLLRSSILGKRIVSLELLKLVWGSLLRHERLAMIACTGVLRFNGLTLGHCILHFLFIFFVFFLHGVFHFAITIRDTIQLWPVVWKRLTFRVRKISVTKSWFKSDRLSSSSKTQRTIAWIWHLNINN